MTRPHLTSRAQTSTQTAYAAPVVIDWRGLAECRDVIGETGMDPFYGTDNEGIVARRTRVRAAKAICARCPVTTECLAADDGFGIRGGLTAAERGSNPPPAEPEYGKACGDRLGTEAGSTRHNRAGEDVCPECAVGTARTRAERYARQAGKTIAAKKVAS